MTSLVYLKEIINLGYGKTSREHNMEVQELNHHSGNEVKR